jgi:hypothetical protein
MSTHPKLSFDSISFVSICGAKQPINKTTKIGSPVGTQIHNVNAKLEGQNIIPLFFSLEFYSLWGGG